MKEELKKYRSRRRSFAQHAGVDAKTGFWEGEQARGDGKAQSAAVL